MSLTQDKLEILELISRYSHVADGDDPQAYADVFTKNGVFHGRAGQPDEIIIKGHEKLKRFLASTLSRKALMQTRHHQSTTTFVEISTTKAKTRTYLLTTTCLKNQTEIQVSLTSIYEDDLLRTPSGWRIKYRKIFPDVKGSLREMQK